MSYSNNNNSLSSPPFVLKMTMITFLIVQAIRQLIQVNIQAGAKTETRTGQIASWFTILLTLIVAALLYPSGPLSNKNIMGGMLLLFAGVMGSGIMMIYDGIKKAGPEKNRLWFGIAHVIFAMLILAFLLFSLVQ